VAWFGFDPSTSTHDVLFTNEDRTVTTCSFENRVILASVGFTKGVHYWEMVVDRYENNKDPAFGVARIDVAKDKILGKAQIPRQVTTRATLSCRDLRVALTSLHSH